MPSHLSALQLRCIVAQTQDIHSVVISFPGYENSTQFTSEQTPSDRGKAVESLFFEAMNHIPEDLLGKPLTMRAVPLYNKPNMPEFVCEVSFTPALNFHRS